MSAPSIMLVLVLALASAVPASHGATRTVAPRFLPTSAPMDYIVSAQETVLTTRAGQSSRSATQTERRIRQSVTSSGDMMEVQQNTTRLTVLMDGMTVELPTDSLTIPSAFTVRSDGVVAGGAAKGDDLGLRWPARPVGRGDRWTGSAVRGDRQPMKIDTTYTLVGVEEFRGEKCLRVDSVSTGASLQKIETARLTMKARSVILFNPRTGIIVSSLGRQRTTLASTATGPDRVEIVREVSTRLTLAPVTSVTTGLLAGD